MTDSSRTLPVLFALWLAAVPDIAPATGAERPSGTQGPFVPGEVWLDTAGKPINAHGGGMLLHSNVSYWYGENKEGPTWLPEANKSVDDDNGPVLEWQETWDLSFFDRQPRPSSTPASPHPPFALQPHEGGDWLVRPDGERFFSLGVCCVNMGVKPGEFNPTNRAYLASQHYADSNQWAAATLERLKSWGFTTVGGWGDYDTLKSQPGVVAAFTPVLHMGSTAGAPWWDMWGAQVMERMERVAREQILRWRDDPRLLGYYSDNELGWWNAALLKLTLEQPPTSGQRQRLMALLAETYHHDWEALLADFDPEGASDWKALEQSGLLYLRPGGNGLAVVRRFAGLLAERYYFLVRQIIRKYDERALILGDRYQSFYYPEVARAAARHVDAVSSNLNAPWNDGTFPRFLLQTLHDLTGRPLCVGEFYMAARQNRSGNPNSHGVFPIARNQRDRAAGFATTLRALLALPYVVGADWFQYYDEPPYGRPDGENYNFGLVDVRNRPYEELTTTAARFDPSALKRRGAPPRPDASQGVPRAPHEPLAGFEPRLALLHWDRERGFVAPNSEAPLADLYLGWDKKALYLGLYAQDVVEEAFYRNKTVPASDRAEWTVAINHTPNAHAQRTEASQPPTIDVQGADLVIRCRVGAGTPPVVNVTGTEAADLAGDDEVQLKNTSGVDLNVRNVSAMKLPAALFGRARFRPGDAIRLTSTFVSHGRGDRTEWSGEFTLGVR